ncbi:Serine/threonine-protein kinase SAPK9 [Tetrabaena socialis]|uniref:Serine/threonine-protein kinase SAPK9 n=1 Tax=Tetrabaena socialis TaxID=47790 RepID=A0A2J8ACD7_9CHLO|nr:Serine/threonine-protein kinase SAPK9 [Tetrabaena socialis]|eukprot:PNH10180.1 Serine/threonine-protein kinase SAPK9 [Tetrabaena socialis]
MLEPMSALDCSEANAKALKREVLSQQRLQHPHVIGFKDVGITTSSGLYLCLEYANGGTLRDMLLRQPGGRLPEDTARWFTQQLVYGLAYCHSQGVCNRDIKPANLLLHSDSESPLMLKIADFGLCKRREDSIPKSYVGTPNYMAEQHGKGSPRGTTHVGSTAVEVLFASVQERCRAVQQERAALDLEEEMRSAWTAEMEAEAEGWGEESSWD